MGKIVKMVVREIIAEWLQEHGYDGLFNTESECACLIEDFFECGYAAPDCEAGYMTKCDCGEHDYHISPNKETSDNART